MPLTLKAINQLEMAKTPIAAEIKASSDDLRSWIAIYPPILAQGLEFFTIRRFEIKKELVDTDIHHEDLLNLEVQQVKSLSEVERVLESWGIIADALQAPWKCDYPL